MTQEELDESIQWEAEQYIPFDVKDVNIDTQILTPEGDATGQMDVLLVAAKKDMINDYTSVVRRGRPDRRRWSTSTPSRSRTPSRPTTSVAHGETVVLINVGRRGGRTSTSSPAASPPSPATSPSAATSSPRRSRSSSTSPTTRPRRSRSAGRARPTRWCPQEVERVIQGVAEQMAGEIQRSLDFYAATAADSRISRVYLSGGTARIPALFKVIEARVGVPVEILNPFKNIEIDNRRFDPAFILAVAPAGGGGGRAGPAPSRGQVSHGPDQPTPSPGLEEEGGGQAAARPLRRWCWSLGLVGNWIWAAVARRRPQGPRGASWPRTREDIAQLERIIGEVKNIKDAAGRSSRRSSTSSTSSRRGAPARCGCSTSSPRSRRKQLWLGQAWTRRAAP